MLYGNLSNKSHRIVCELIRNYARWTKGTWFIPRRHENCFSATDQVSRGGLISSLYDPSPLSSTEPNRISLARTTSGEVASLHVLRNQRKSISNFSRKPIDVGSSCLMSTTQFRQTKRYPEVMACFVCTLSCRFCVSSQNGHQDRELLNFLFFFFIAECSPINRQQQSALTIGGGGGK